MGQADVVICATGAPGFLIEKSAVAAILPHKRSKPLLLIDIALPRDIDPACGSFENVYLFDIDDLRVVVDSHIEERKLAARKAHLIIEENLNGVETWLRRTDINPVIANFRSYVDDILARESQKTMSRQIFQNLTEEQRDALQQLLHTISDRLTSDAGSRIRSLESPHLARARALGLLELFPLENFENQNGKK
jgi:glutamyl-tRNA reductase